MSLKACYVNDKLLVKWEVRSSSVVFKCEPVCMHINIMSIEDCGMGCASNTLLSGFRLQLSSISSVTGVVQLHVKRQWYMGRERVYQQRNGDD